jgi:WS/DGAT/MGAT family acyltransferase
VFSTRRDLAAYADALLHDGENPRGRVLSPASMAQMFDRQYENAPGLAAIGLAFFRTDLDGHRVVSHDGILPGFNTHLAVAPDDGLAVIGLTNGSRGAMRWLPAEMDDLLRDLLDLPAHRARAETPHHPEIWGEIRGRYLLPPPGDLRGRLAMGGGLQVFVTDGRPMLRVRMPIPALWRGMPLQPDDTADPRAFRLDLSQWGMGEVRLRFATEPGTGRKLMHTDLGGQPITFTGPPAPRKPRPAVDRLGNEDQLMLLMSRAWPQDIGALAMLDGAPLFDGDGRFRIGAVRDHVASRLHLVPRLRQVIRSPRRGRGGPYWTDAPAFDLGRHVQEVRLPPASGEAELFATVEKLRAQRFERRHPLWRIWFLTGLPDGQVAMFVKLHHTIGDGLAAMTIVSAFLDPGPDVPAAPIEPWVPRPGPRPSQLVADNLRGRLAAIGRTMALLGRPRHLIRALRTAWPAIRELVAERPGDGTSIDCLVGDGRRLALAQAGYRPVRRIGRTAGATVNDVLLASTAAGIRRLLAERGEPVDDVTIRTYVPVSLRHRLRGPQDGNQIAQMAVPLALAEMDPLERLRHVARETRRRKARVRPSLDRIFSNGLVSMLLLRLVIAQRVNVTTASIPGPRRPAYLVGARVLAVFPVLPLIGNQPIGVGAISYADTFTVGITADRDAVPDLEQLAAGLRDELAALTKEE